jgi:hypothetical protein
MHRTVRTFFDILRGRQVSQKEITQDLRFDLCNLEAAEQL